MSIIASYNIDSINLTCLQMNSPGRIDLDRITKVPHMRWLTDSNCVIFQSSDLSNSYETEDDKIKAMMSQSTQEYDPSKYVKSRGLVGPLPPNYTCYRCGQPGHYIKHCPTNNVIIECIIMNKNLIPFPNLDGNKAKYWHS